MLFSKCHAKVMRWQFYHEDIQHHTLSYKSKIPNGNLVFLEINKNFMAETPFCPYSHFSPYFLILPHLVPKIKNCSRFCPYRYLTNRNCLRCRRSALLIQNRSTILSPLSLSPILVIRDERKREEELPLIELDLDPSRT